MEPEEAGVEEDLSRAPEEEQVVENEDGGATGHEQDEPNWKELATNYKNALTQKRQLRKEGVTTPPEGESVQVTREDIRELIQEVVAPLVTTSAEDRLLTAQVKDPSKREFVKQLLQNRIVRTGTSEEDIENDIADAIAMADRKKTAKTVAELTRAANNRPLSPSAGSSTEPPVEQKHYKWTAAEVKALDAKADALGIDREAFKKSAWENAKKTRIA